MGMQTLVAELPDGRIVTRKTDRDYQLLVSVLWNDAQGVWGAWRWSTRLDLADGALRFLRKLDNVADAQIVPVVIASPNFVKGLRDARRRRLTSRAALR